jgi:hypothetical protein
MTDLQWVVMHEFSEVPVSENMEGEDEISDSEMQSSFVSGTE